MSLPSTHNQQHVCPPEQDIIIHHGVIVTTERQFEADIRIHNDKIAEIGHNLTVPQRNVQKIDAQGLLVMPGGIDPHVHLTLPDSAPADDRWVDDLTSGSQAALSGGVTTVGNISFPEEGETPLETITRDTQKVQTQAIADVILHPVIFEPTDDVLAEIPQMAASGYPTIKVFMTAEFDKQAQAYLNMMAVAGKQGIVTMLHCEDFAMIAYVTEKMLNEGRCSLRYYAESRPVISEVVATQRAVAMCEVTGAPVYIVHLSSMRALQVCEEAQARNLPVYVETRPLYLHLTKKCFLEPDGAIYVGQPPLREALDMEYLWNGLKKGTIHTIGTDHAPWTREQKLDPSLNVKRLRPGVNNLQVMLPMLWSEGVRPGKITPEQFVALTSTNVAKLFGLYPKKGAIMVDSDADLVLWNSEEQRVIRGTDMFSKAGFSIYEGWEVSGWPKMTIRRGQIVYENGQITAEPGSGQVVKRALS